MINNYTRFIIYKLGLFHTSHYLPVTKKFEITFPKIELINGKHFCSFDQLGILTVEVEVLVIGIVDGCFRYRLCFGGITDEFTFDISDDESPNELIEKFNKQINSLGTRTILMEGDVEKYYKLQELKKEELTNAVISKTKSF